MTHHEPSKTGIRNEEYDLVSVYYHALQGAQTCDAYRQNAEQAGNNNLAQFFKEIQQEDVKRAEKTRQLLGQVIGQSVRS